MSSLKYLDITNCQNITLESLVSSLYMKKKIEISHMKNQAQEILETCALSKNYFSPERPSAMWERFLADYKYIQFDDKVLRN